jgi:hypothetical protein
MERIKLSEEGIYTPCKCGSVKYRVCWLDMDVVCVQCEECRRKTQYMSYLRKNRDKDDPS